MSCFPDYEHFELHFNGGAPCDASPFQEAWPEIAEKNFTSLKRAIGMAIEVYEGSDGPPPAARGGSPFYLAMARLHFRHTITLAIRELEKASFVPNPECATGFCVVAVSALTLAIGSYLQDECYHLHYHDGQTFLPEYAPRDPSKPVSVVQDIRDLVTATTAAGVTFSDLRQDDPDRTPVNPTNLFIIQTALAALPDEYARDYPFWFKVACALYAFDDGPIGLELFTTFSMRCPEKAANADFDGLWASLSRGYSGKRITLGSLIHWAKENGWTQPCPWNRVDNANREAV